MPLFASSNSSYNTKLDAVVFLQVFNIGIVYFESISQDGGGLASISFFTPVLPSSISWVCKSQASRGKSSMYVSSENIICDVSLSVGSRRLLWKTTSCLSMRARKGFKINNVKETDVRFKCWFFAFHFAIRSFKPLKDTPLPPRLFRINLNIKFLCVCVVLT